MITDHGIFALYDPDNRDDALPDVLFCRNEDGLDWYELQASLEPGSALVEIDPDTGRITGKTGDGGAHDYSTRWPCNKRLLEIKPASDADGLTFDMQYSSGAFGPVPLPKRTELSKSDIIDRMTDAELEDFSQALGSASIRLRMMWDNCIQVEAASSLFPLLRQQFVVTWGDVRAAAILSLDPQ